MDAMDVNQLIQISDDSKNERRMVTLNIESGVPATSTLKKLYNVPVVEPKLKKKITAEQQATLDAAWALRVKYKRAMHDSSTPDELQVYKKKYFAAIDEFKRVYSSIYGAS